MGPCSRGGEIELAGRKNADQKKNAVGAKTGLGNGLALWQSTGIDSQATAQVPLPSHGWLLAPPLSVCTQTTPGAGNRQCECPTSRCSAQNERSALQQQRRRRSGSGVRGAASGGGAAVGGAVCRLSHAAAAPQGGSGAAGIPGCMWAGGRWSRIGWPPACPNPPGAATASSLHFGADAEADGVGEARGAGPGEHCRPHVPHGPDGHAGAGH